MLYFGDDRSIATAGEEYWSILLSEQIKEGTNFIRENKFDGSQIVLQLERWIADRNSRQNPEIHKKVKKTNTMGRRSRSNRNKARIRTVSQ